MNGAVQLLVALCTGGLGGIAIDSRWAYNRGYAARLRDERTQAPAKFDQVYREEIEKARREAEVKRAEAFDRTTIPHGVEGHDCTLKCYFNTDRPSSWDV